MPRPVIGITADVHDGRHALKPEYVDVVLAAGGVPLIIPASADAADEVVGRCDGVLLTGGDDPIMEAFGEATHPAAKTIDPRRQDAELAVIRALESRPEVAVLAVCLGMQLLGLQAGGRLHQHLDEVLEDADVHKDDRVHVVEGSIGNGRVTSWHHQALADAGRLEVIGRAPDGVIEAVADVDRPFCIGVQWHPERTGDSALGSGLIRRFIDACAPKD